MKKNLIFLTLLISVLMVSVVSAGITGYLVSRGGGIADAGYTAVLQKVDRSGTATVAVTTPTGDTELVRVAEGETAKVGEAQISADSLTKGTLFRRAGANVEINLPEEASSVAKIATLCPSGQICQNEWCGLEERPACANTGGCFSGQICQSDGFCEVEEKKFCGATVTGHTHLSDYKHGTGKLFMTGTGLVQGIISCKAEFGNDYVVLGGGFQLTDALETGMIINGPDIDERYRVSLNVNATNNNLPNYGKVFATCARVEPTLHQFGQDY